MDPTRFELPFSEIDFSVAPVEVGATGAIQRGITPQGAPPQGPSPQGAAVHDGAAVSGSSASWGATAPWGAEVIGQPRALEALRMGVRIRSKGYNVWVSGAPGTGRRTAVLRVLSDEPGGVDRLRDIGFVYDFDAPLEPRMLSFAAGKGREFKRELHRLVETLKDIVRLQAESDSQKKVESGLVAEREEKENARLAAFEAELAADGFRAVQVESGDGGGAMDIVPLTVKGVTALGQDEAAKPSAGGSAGPASGPGLAPTPADEDAQSPDSAMPEETEETEIEETSFEKLQELVAAGAMSEADYNDLRNRWYGHMDRMRALFAELRRGRAELDDKLKGLREEAIAPHVEAETQLLSRRWNDPAISSWLRSFQKDVLGHLWLFQEGLSPRKAAARRRSPALGRYGINLVIDRGSADRPPVVVENHPTLSNLFGFVEPKPEEDGDTRTAYLRIRSGTFLQAAGGYLVLRAEDVLSDEEVWVRLKRALQDGKVEIQPREGPFGASAWLKPEAVPADVKVIFVGGEGSYDVLYQADPDFQKLFKIHAEFDSTMPRSGEGIRDYAAFAAKIVTEEGLLPIDSGGLAAIVEEGMRLAEYRGRLSTRFGLIADLIRESDYRARARKAAAIDGDSVHQAVAVRARLANLPEEKLEEMIATGEIIMQIEGKATGRINGLAVHDRGYYAFGLPAVISAQVSPGEGGVINIEGESGLSGEIYDKAVLIVEGFIRSRYARDFPLGVTASICFEQSYTAIEGDSASSTAVYALLSAISGIPLRQDIAVTGSMNQTGQVQPVGGVNEKVEGFFRVCKQAGLTGTQGVMLPRRNAGNLILPREIREAIASGSFHIWAVSSIDEGLEVLAGIEAGVPNDRGEFVPDSFNGRVRRELQRMAKTVKNYLG
ncbi:MAG TPA: ATP-binding protein [Rectinemataceae bacterium]|nr:ATP-binding protein [Rectinemataceae bacterium]